MYSITKFFDKEECLSILDICDTKGIPFSYMSNSDWDCKRVYDDELKQRILNLFEEMRETSTLNSWFDFSNFKINDINTSITKYYDNKKLDLHLDKTSQLTTVIVLTENFIGGEFLLNDGNSNKNIELNLDMGYGVTFDGSKILHGVNPVSSGIRSALNIWMTDTDFRYKDFSKKTLL